MIKNKDNLSSSTVHYICFNCNRKYKNKISYDKHLLICNIMSKSIKERARENDEIDNTPSIRELYSIILHLTNKCEIMEKKLEKISNTYNKDKKKINVLEWLNNNKIYIDDDEKEIPVFQEWINTINIVEEDMNYVSEHTFLDGLKYIIKRLLREIDTGDYNMYIPIRAFDQRENLFYIYDYNEDYGNINEIKNDIREKKWILMSQEKLNQLFTKISKGLITQLRIWKDKNIHRISEDSFTQVYANHVKKITGGQLSIQEQQNKFRKYLYNSIKINIKTFIECEYEF